MRLRPDTPNAVRRHAEQRVDQAWAVTAHRLRPGPTPPPVPGGPRVGIVSVNASTTRYLKLMLLTLARQDALDLVTEIVVVDHGSRDGGRPFLRRLARAVPRIRLVEHRWFLNHARGMRAGERVLDPSADVVLFCDPDVVWRNPAALGDLVGAMTDHDAAIAGEPRRAFSSQPRACPDVQASFLAVRRDVLHRRDIRPPVNHGSPTLWLQQDVVRAGLGVAAFPSNHGGYVLHRGRTAVAAAHEFAPRRSYATAPTRFPHYMGVPNGAEIWAEIEARFAHLLAPEAEPALLDALADRLDDRA